MTQEDKQLLLVDLCGKLSYGVKVSIEYSKGEYTRIFDLRKIDNDTISELRQQVTVWDYGFYSSVITYPLINCRPHLRPMSSMTDDEKKEYELLTNRCIATSVGFVHFEAQALIDWLDKNMFDHRGLIPKGLALEAHEGIYKSLEKLMEKYEQRKN